MELWARCPRSVGIGRRQAYAAAHKGQIPTIRIGKRLLVPLTRFQRMLEGDGGTTADNKIDVRREYAARASALWYGANGWHVFPLNPGRKVPLTPRGFHDATTDAGTIRKWWSDNPNANIGIATEPSGLVVVDVDSKNSGDSTFEALRAELGAHTFNTVTALTPSGGQHFVYRAQDNVVKSGVHVLGQVSIYAPGAVISLRRRALQRGENFLGRRCQPGKALWVGVDETAEDFLTEAEIIGLDENMPVIFDRPTRNRTAWLFKVIEQHEPDIIIVDTISRFCDIEDVNSYSEVERGFSCSSTPEIATKPHRCSCTITARPTTPWAPRNGRPSSTAS